MRPAWRTLGGGPSLQGEVRLARAPVHVLGLPLGRAMVVTLTLTLTLTLLLALEQSLVAADDVPAPVPASSPVSAHSGGASVAQSPPQDADGAANEAGSATAATVSVEFSDGHVLRGPVELSEPLRVQIGDALCVLRQDRVASIALAPTAEGMDQGWRFAQPGQPRKIPVGKPYPVRHLVAEVTSVDGTLTRGHLISTICWVDTSDDQRERVILPAKQEGSPGQTLADLVYPMRVVLRPVLGSARAPRLVLGAQGAAPPQALPVLEAVLITVPALERIVLAGPGPSWELPTPAQVPAVLSCRRADGWHVAWPPQGSPAVTATAADAVAAAQDFLDRRTLLGAWDASPTQLFALVLAVRAGPTSMPGPDKPWRLEVWRWARDQDRLLWAGRGYIARGLYANAQQLPRVILETAWWSQAVRGSELIIAGENHGR